MGLHIDCYSTLKFLLVEKKTYHVVKLNLDQNGQRNDRKGNIFGGNGGSVIKNPPAGAENAENMCSIPQLGRSPGVGNGNLLQYSCLENSIDRGTRKGTAHGVAKSQTRLSTHTCTHAEIGHWNSPI